MCFDVHGSGVCDASLIYIQNQKLFRNIKKFEKYYFRRYGRVGGVLEFVRSRTMEEGRVKNSDFSRTYFVNDPLVPRTPRTHITRKRSAKAGTNFLKRKDTAPLAVKLQVGFFVAI